MQKLGAVLIVVVMAALILFAWWLPNRPQNPAADVSVTKFNSLSFESYRPWESPFTNHFPTAAETDADLALVAPITRAIRTYAAIEGGVDIAALAQKHGLKLWQGIWLGGDRAHNALEMARAIDLAHRYPDVIERVVVGNEVLLRRDLPVDELIADIDHVKSAVKQQVAYADVSDFWEQFPQIAPHVDVALIHLLPYWEDKPTGINGAVAYVGQIYTKMHALFPKTQIAIGETGWPSRGRERADATPGLINEARFLREFIALSREKNFDYNFIEAFDQNWKYESEGIVGANWGIFDADRHQKIPLQGPLEENPRWRKDVAISIACGLLLTALGLATGQGRRPILLCTLGMSLGAALGFAYAGTDGVLYDLHVRLAATINIGGQALLAALMMLRVSGKRAPCPHRTGADTTRAVQQLFHGSWPGTACLFEDIAFLFLWTAAVLQILLVFDPRYREFPTTSFTVPILVAVARRTLREPTPAFGREERLLIIVLLIGAFASVIQEGLRNDQSFVWFAALMLYWWSAFPTRSPTSRA